MCIFERRSPLLNVAPHLPSMNVEHNVTSKKLIRKVLLQSKKAKCPVNQMDCLLHTINSMVPEITYGHDEHTQLSWFFITFLSHLEAKYMFSCLSIEHNFYVLWIRQVFPSIGFDTNSTIMITNVMLSKRFKIILEHDFKPLDIKVKSMTLHLFWFEMAISSFPNFFCLAPWQGIYKKFCKRESSSLRCGYILVRLPPTLKFD